MGSDRDAVPACRSLFFPGCSVLSFLPVQMELAYDALTRAGQVDGISLLCCGKLLAFEPDAAVVQPAFEERLARALADAGVRRVVAACPNCVESLRALLERWMPERPIEVVPLPEALLEAGLRIGPEGVRAVLAADGASGGDAFDADGDAGRGANESAGRGADVGSDYGAALPRLTVQDPCPDRARGEFARGIRALLPEGMLVEKRHSRDCSFCCGSMARAEGRPDAARRAAERHGEEAREVAADALVTSCSSCAQQLAKMQGAVPVHHYLELLFGEPVDWAAAPDHISVRYLFEEAHGLREYDRVPDSEEKPARACARMPREGAALREGVAMSENVTADEAAATAAGAADAAAAIAATAEGSRAGEPAPAKRHALLVFSKPPIPGLVKTRMTKERGGFLTPEQAAEFFTRSLYDVSELCMHALIELQRENDAAVEADPSVAPVRYDFFVSTTPAENLGKMRETFEALAPWPMEVHYLVDSGKTFDEHFDDAFRQLFEAGYESVVSVGGDIPTMPKSHITQAFQWLDYFQSLGTPGFVQAPCQECGTSLVGYSFNTPIDNQGVYYNLDGTPALDAYVAKLKERDIPSVFLSPISDIDEKTDLAHAISCLRAIELAAPHQPGLFVARRVLDWVDYMGLRVVTPPNDEHDPRQYIDK